MNTNTENKAVLLENILMRAAGQIGDVTVPVMTAFYRRYPEARQAFEIHGLGNLPKLEGGMVENSIYCLMRWVEAPSEIRIMFNESVPHHNDILRVPPEWYTGLIEATVDVIGETIPANCKEERELWHATCDQLSETIGQCGVGTRLS